MWLARDKNGLLYLFYNKPEKVKGEGYWTDNTCDYICLGLHDYPEIKWKDKEPVEVDLIIKNNSNYEH